MEDTLLSLAIEIDDAAEKNDSEKLENLVSRCQVLTNDQSFNKSILFFYQANCHASLASIRSDRNRWSWQENETLSQVLCLRRSVSEASFDAIDRINKAKIFTNLGNSLNSLGRFIEAIRYWDLALNELPNFAMALGNKGIGVFEYAISLYDTGHSTILAHEASKLLKRAISRESLWDSGPDDAAKTAFLRYKNRSTSFLTDVEFNSEFELEGFSLGKSKAERTYRSWVLDRKLFLSPLNDAVSFSVAAADTIHLPSHRYNLPDTPRYPNYFNILKQEFITARYALFEARTGKPKHFSDTDTLLINGYDGVYFGYRNEQMKIAYKLAYSILDKVALFINEYFMVELPPGQVNFKKIWEQEKKGKLTLRPIFVDRENWPLRGLYFLSKDLFDENFLASSLPEAKQLAELRNKAEHRFLSLQEFAFNVESTENHIYVTVDAFEQKVIKVLSMAREALIYLSLAMHREEGMRWADDEDALIFEVPSEPL